MLSAYNVKIKQIIKGKLLSFGNWLFLALEQDKWEKEKNMFKSLGKNVHIPEPRRIYNAKYISIGNNFSSLNNTRIEAIDEYCGQYFKPSIIIGDNVNMNTDCHVGCIDKIIIGNNVLIASRVYISDHYHGFINEKDIAIEPARRPLSSKGPVIIEDNVWIGEGVCILPGVVVGRNSIIGANSVVTKSVPENSVVAGIPAKIIKKLTD